MKIHLKEINSVILIKLYNYKILLALCSAVFHLMWNNLFVIKQPKISVYFSDSWCNYSKCSCTCFITLISTCITVYIHLSFFIFNHISTTVLTPWSQEQVQVLPLPTSARTNTALFLYWCSSKTSWISAGASFGTAYNSCQLSHFPHHITLQLISKWYKILCFKRNLLHFEKCISKHKCKYSIYKPQYQKQRKSEDIEWSCNSTF